MFASRVEDPRQKFLASLLSLPLLMFWVRACDVNNSLPPHDFTMFANPFYRTTYFHKCIPFLNPIRDSSPCQIIGRKLNFNPISRKNSNVMHPHLSRNMRQYFMSIIKL